MTRIFLSLILGILPQALYFMLYLTKVKDITNKRIKFLLLIYIIITLTIMIIRYNIYLYLMIIPLIYGAMKLLYKRKAQIIDIFLIASGFGYMIIISYLCSFIYKNNYNLYWIAYAINNILLFSIFAFINQLKALYRKYIRKIVDEGSPEEMQKLSDILVNLIEYAEETNDDVYHKNAICIYMMANGNKIDRDLAEEIVNNMRPYEERWTFDDIEKIKRDYNMDDMRAEDIYLVMNQGFNDYRDTLFGDDLSNYIKYTKAFINDPDAKTLMQRKIK